MDKRIKENMQQRVGISVISKDGMRRTCIAYRGVRHVDIVDENGVILKDVTWQSFYEKKSDFHRLYCRIEHLGEKHINSQGDGMTIIAYHSISDIDVQFDDGTIREHVQYYNFKRGCVPRISVNNVIDKYIGKSVVSLDGYRMTIIAYRSYLDIDIQYDDGEVKNVYYEFWKNRSKRYPVTHLGETSIATDGSIIKCIAYRNFNDIDVQFDNGEIREHTSYHAFSHGALKKPVSVIGEKNIASNGQEMEIIEYFDAKNITVKFEDGTIVTNVSIHHFREGKVLNPNSRLTGVSYNELLVAYYLKPFGFCKMTGYDLEEIGIKGFNKMELDLFAEIQGERIAIEYDGFFTHTEAHDKKKNDLCKKNNIFLIRIREPQLEKYNFPNVKMLYLDSEEQASASLSKAIEDVINYINHIVSTGLAVSVDFERDKLDFKDTLPEIQTNLLVDRIGKTAIASNGMKMVIITYRNCNDIDVQFEDGIVVEHQYYGRFLKGDIVHPQNNAFNNRINKYRKEREGAIRYTKSREKITCIVYRNSADIDVQFEDGTIRQHMPWASFDDGKISKIKGMRPFMQRSEEYKKKVENFKNQVVGLTKAMKNGMKATITGAKSINNISVKFENGITEYGSYESFVAGMIEPKPEHFRVGQYNVMKCGIGATITQYNSARNLTVQFDDGAVVNGVAYSSFKIGQIAHPTVKTRDIKNDQIAKERIGMTNIMNCGMMATIIDYCNNKKVTVQFIDGSTITTSYDCFCKGKVGHPILSKEKKKERAKNLDIQRNLCYNAKYEGETRIMNCGMNATIILYRKSTDIDVLFEDGYMACHKKYQHFKTGSIGNPNIQKNVLPKSLKGLKKERLGQSNIMECGLEATIVKYTSCKNMVIQFTDGVIKKSTYSAFLKGSIAHPTIHIHREQENQGKKKCRENYIGQTKMMNCGKSATIIEYRSSSDIDVQFEDGILKQHVDCGNFKKGTIAHPYIKETHVGETIKMTCGMDATILEYRSFRDIDVMFEDGTVVKNKQYGSFKNRHIKNPALCSKKHPQPSCISS